jgi:2-aminophenol/2-amino-5-chlorophenol 1,6-dioxygenase subunit alpha
MSAEVVAGTDRATNAPASTANNSGVVAGFIVPGYPHPLLVPDANPGYQRIRDAYAEVRARIEELRPDLLLLYSTQWPSVIGHQVQADPDPEWVHVDQEWHELGPIPYKFRMDADFGTAYVEHGRARGLEMRTVAYRGFPIDTGSIVALKLLDPDNRIPASIVSCNMYADRAETIVLGKAARDAVAATGKRVVAIAVTALSNRVHTGIVPFGEDRIHSQKDDEWNRKYLEILERGRLEDAAQLTRKFHAEAGGDQKMKAIWWLNTVMGQSNTLDGHLYAYEALYGTGAAVVGLVPTVKDAEAVEFDEDDAEVYLGDRNVLGGANLFESADGVDIARSGQDLDEVRAQELGMASDAPTPAAPGAAGPRSAVQPGNGRDQVIVARSAPKPVGAYPHARRVGDLLYLSGLGPRDPETDKVPGGPVWDADGTRNEYDAAAQTEAVIDNMKRVLAASGATIEDVVDVTCYLIDMERDFAAFNAVYAKHFGDVQATRTTLEINRLPTPIAVEFKVIAKAP